MFSSLDKGQIGILCLVQLLSVVYCDHILFHCGFEESEPPCGMTDLPGDTIHWTSSDLNGSSIQSHSGGSHIFIKRIVSGTLRDRATVATSPLDYNGTVCVGFVYYDVDIYSGELQMMKSDDGVVWEVLWSSDGGESSTWVAVRYTHYRSNTNTVVAFLGLVGSTWGEIALDQVNISSGCCDQVTCTEVAPRNISVWSAWNPWSQCSLKCGRGFSQRERFCIERQLGGVCAGLGFQRRNCSKLADCPVVWGEWHSWGICDTDCGVGFKRRRRVCMHLRPTTKTCIGHDWQGKECTPDDCKPCPASCNSCREDPNKCDVNECQEPYQRIALTGLCVDPSSHRGPQIWKSVILFTTVSIAVCLLGWLVAHLSRKKKDPRSLDSLTSTRSNQSKHSRTTSISTV